MGALPESRRLGKQQDRRCGEIQHLGNLQRSTTHGAYYEGRVVRSTADECCGTIEKNSSADHGWYRRIGNWLFTRSPRHHADHKKDRYSLICVRQRRVVDPCIVFLLLAG